MHIFDGVFMALISSRNIKFVSFARPSGSGEMTLLNLIGCLDKPVGGFNYVS